MMCGRERPSCRGRFPAAPRREARHLLGQKPVWPLSTPTGPSKHLTANVRFE